MISIRVFRDAGQRKRTFLILTATLVFTLVRYRLQYGFYVGEFIWHFFAGWIVHLLGFGMIGGIATAFFQTYSLALFGREAKKFEELFEEILVIQALLILAASFLILSSIYQIFSFEE